MVRRQTGDKLGDIRRATVAEVVESGSSAASVNAIAKRAGLAVGTVYRYYDNKEQLLRAVYLAIKTDLHDVMMEAVEIADTIEAKIKAMWFAVLDFSFQRPDDFLYVEVILNDLILSAKDKHLITEMAADSRTIIADAVTEGLVRDVDINAIVTLLTAPALQLGRAAALSGDKPDSTYTEKVFNLCWRAIKA